MSASLLRACEIIAAMPAAYLKRPEKGESYGLNSSAESPRIQAYALPQGFLISVASGSVFKNLMILLKITLGMLSFCSHGGISRNSGVR
ncbi:hypothetical protein BDZ91DRAFT_737971 [Kalaharituber pfeilii]|nr:hypothetical protein BDZ91DRAFT_737971 [Kalaharituber pfeilii]